MQNPWWKEEVIYQIYPRSFNDSNGDGIGDLQGIIQKLDYLKNLGVDILWLSPIYKSPNDDNGYDISDYYGIMDEFGTMADFDELLEAIHQRGMRLLMDLVVNHTSDEHEWFQQSRLSEDNPYRDYYYWKKEKPNNWPSFFGGETWEYDELTDAYYLHLFTKKQPDLNWENPKVRQEIYKLMRFWLDKGIDGFRMDVISVISKQLDFPKANTDDFNHVINTIYANGPRVHEFIQEMNREVMSHYDCMTVGEGPGISTKVVNDYVGKDRAELDMVFHFGHMFLGHGKSKFDLVPVNLVDFKKVFTTWNEAIGEDGWVNIFLDNHDFARMVSRWGNDGEYRKESAKLLSIIILTMRGTPCIYQGSEIGMTNIKMETLDDFDDVEIKNYVAEMRERGEDPTTMIPIFNKMGRDNARTPIQWTATENAGFTAGEPWLKINPNYTEINAEAALADKDSVFYYYQKMIQLRKQHPTLIYGDYEDLAPDSDELFIYRRWDEEHEYLIFLNFSNEYISLFNLQSIPADALLICNYKMDRFGHTPELAGWEARVYQVK